MSTKILINGDFKAIRKGEFVEASEADGEFIVCEGNEMNLTIAQLNEIASANGITLQHKKKAEAATELCDALSNLKIPTVNEETTTQKVRRIVEAGHAAGTSEDEMLIEIVQAGVKFSAAVKELKNALQELGLATSPKERFEKAKVVLSEAKFKPETWEDVTNMAEELVKSIPDTNEKQAVGAIRKYCKSIEVEMPKAPKKAAGAGAPVGFRGKLLDWIGSNPTSDEKALTAFVEANKPQNGKTDILVRRFGPILKMANRVASEASK